jgi:hypothetical protein
MINFEGEFNLIKPSDFLLKNASEYINSYMPEGLAKDSIFIPSGIGVLLTPKMDNKLFSELEDEKSSIYDINPLKGRYFFAQTTESLSCGVAKAKFEGYKLMAYANSPKSLKCLTARGLQLAIEDGAKLNECILINIYYNPRQNQKYESLIELMAKNANLNAIIAKYPVTYTSKIKV